MAKSSKNLEPTLEVVVFVLVGTVWVLGNGGEFWLFCDAEAAVWVLVSVFVVVVADADDVESLWRFGGRPGLDLNS